jgi:DNA-binding SARP family transcriptional activator
MVSTHGGFGGSEQSLSISVLGPQVIYLKGAELDAPAPQQRRVLSLLASRPNEVVSREWIAHGLWGSATATQLRGLQVYVSNLRSALGKSSIDLVGNGYRLNVPPDAIDEVNFKNALTLGHDAVAHERYDEAIEHLTFGLSLWRGEPYDDLPHGDFIARRAGLLEAKHAAEDALLRAEVEFLRDIGSAEALIPRSAELHAEQARREGRVMLHLRCLMIAGRLTDASAIANDYRNRMRAEVGVEPGPQFADFYARLMRRDASLLPAAWGSSVNVPTFSTPLIGRDRELELAISLLRGDSTRLLTITCPAQVGCTRLAAATAERLGHGLPGGVI